jgi:hypothetical protein
MSKFQNGPPISITLVTPLAIQTLNVASRRALLRAVSALPPLGCAGILTHNAPYSKEKA